MEKRWKELEAAWGVQVFDRFTVVLHIFRCNARTKEARLQVALAELPVLRSRLKDRISHLDGRGGSSRYIMGSGESLVQLQQQHLMRAEEMKIRKALERLREFPVVSVVGYTNSDWKSVCPECPAGRTHPFNKKSGGVILTITCRPLVHGPWEAEERREREREREREEREEGEEQEASTPICALTRQAQGFEPATSAFPGQRFTHCATTCQATIPCLKIAPRDPDTVHISEALHVLNAWVV
ncbi:putative GTP-binding protein 6 [Saccopteryx bilineata]|uniref:putative GTP-binding protein 6 n=1 Tax=Saccopteryx bilineata TaxID=59482 RepID=UPI0033902E2D